MFQVLKVDVLDKDEGSVHDDFIGSFTTSISPGAKEVEIVSTIRKVVRGSFWMNVSPRNHYFSPFTILLVPVLPLFLTMWRETRLYAV